MTKIAGCLLAFERPHYLRRTINSLENLEEKDELDWYIFQDGAVNKFSGRRLATDKNVKIANNILQKADLPNKTIVQNEYNLGIPNQYYKMYNLLFNKHDYDRIIGFEDDIVVSKYGIGLKNLMLDKYPDCIPTLYTNRSIENVNVQKKINVLVKNYTGSSFRTFAVADYMYYDIEDRYEEYLDIVGDIDYMTRDHDKINDKFGSNVSSNDAVMQKLYADNGYFRLMPYVSRALSIGMEGLHTETSRFQKNFEGNLGQLEYEQDNNPPNFKVKVRDEVKNYD